MTKIIFDDVHEFELDGYYEYPLRNELNAYKSYIVGQQEIPAIVPVTGFTTVKIVEGDTEIPLAGNYTAITSFVLSYVADTNMYSLNINLN